ncbi:MAG: ABC transporter permease, partial [Phycisphaeraceae bacterium]
LLIGAGIGLVHGVLIGYANMQPFIVTLCGLMGYRGLARLVSDDRPLGLGQHHESIRYLADGEPLSVPVPFIESIAGTGDTGGGFLSWVAIPMPLIVFLALSVLGAILLHKTVLGRYLLAMGRNSEAARFSGIDTRRMTVVAYVLCSVLAALGGVLFALDLGSIQPSNSGNFYELYAIAAAVLGGCALRGGVGSIAGVVVGTAVIRTLYNAINLLDKPAYWQFIIIGLVLLVGVMIDEIGRQVINRVKTRRRRKMLTK